MSRADERRAEQDDYMRDALAHERQSETGPIVTPDPDPDSWSSRCAGWQVGVHEKARIEETGWRCRWCWQLLTPPTPEDIARNKALALDAPIRQRPRRRY